MAKDLARRIGYAYVDTGAMYRAVTLYAIRNRLIAADGTIDTDGLQASLPDIRIEFRPEGAFLNGELVERDIRTIEVSNHVSPVAALPFVRTALVAMQQQMGDRGGIVMDGRDIGTVVLPHAELKVFVTASAQVRAERRYRELQEKGMPADFDEILRNVEERDYIDTHRAIGPLRQAPDALLLDNSNMTIEEQNDWLYRQYLRAAE